MKRIFSFCLVLFLALAVRAQETVDMSQYEPKIPLDTAAPAIVLPDSLGKEISLASLRGNWVVVDFWASWCGDCRREMPALKEMYSQQSKRGVKFLGVSFDTDPKAWKHYVSQQKLAWPQVCNFITMRDNPVAKAYDIHWIPTFFLISPEGKAVGFAFTVDELGKLMDVKMPKEKK